MWEGVARMGRCEKIVFRVVGGSGVAAQATSSSMSPFNPSPTSLPALSAAAGQELPRDTPAHAAAR